MRYRVDTRVLFKYLNYPAIPIHRDPLAAFQSLGYITQSENCRDAEFPGHDGTVGQNAADIGNQCNRMGKKLGP